MTSSTAGNPQTTMDHEGTIDAEALRQAVAESFDETIGQLTDLVAAEDPDVVEAAGPHEAGDGVGAAVQRGGIKAGPGDACVQGLT